MYMAGSGRSRAGIGAVLTFLKGQSGMESNILNVDSMTLLQGGPGGPRVRIEDPMTNKLKFGVVHQPRYFDQLNPGSMGNATDQGVEQLMMVAKSAHPNSHVGVNSMSMVENPQIMITA